MKYSKECDLTGSVWLSAQSKGGYTFWYCWP